MLHLAPQENIDCIYFVTRVLKPCSSEEWAHSINNLIHCFNINNHCVHEHDSKHRLSVEWVEALFSRSQ